MNYSQAILDIDKDLINNPAKRCACMVVLDTSFSMYGDEIKELNRGIQTLVPTLQQNKTSAASVELGVITAGGVVKEQLTMRSVMSLDYSPNFSASGNTPLGEAIELALARLDARKAKYKQSGTAYFQPWLIIISDGAPTDTEVWSRASQKVVQLAKQKKLVPLVVGVKGADMKTLSRCSNRPALHLDGLRFQDMFQWISASMIRVSASAANGGFATLPPITWADDQYSWDSL